MHTGLVFPILDYNAVVVAGDKGMYLSQDF